jgi:tetratricopeptide (TPR) repeat protein
VQRLHALAGGDSAVQRRVASAIGLTTEQFPVEELFWGARELLAGLARERPLVAIFEDLHWAELTFLELLQHVADSARAPILLLGTARRDVLDLRPGWCERAGERLIPLAPLEGDALATVIDAQLGGALAPAVRERIVAAASGNPLFAEQLVSMLVDEGRLQRRDDGWVAADGLDDLAVPPTIQALLGARLDQLPRPERDVIEPASVVGVEFEVAAVRALLDAPAPVDPQLADLERKQLVNRIDEAAYAFEHILLRDTAYGRLLKRVRADLHVRFVRWAEEVYTARGGGDELAEVLGYHLEQAHRYLAELGPLDDEGRALGTRAAARLAVAGRRAFNREDMPAAANLLRRAATLLGPEDPRRLPLLLPLGEAFEDVGDFPVAAMFLEEAIEQAEAIGDAATAALARVARLLVEGQSGGADVGERIIAAATDAIPRLADAENHAGLAAAWRAQAWVHGTAGRFGRTAAAAERAVFHATRAGDDRQRRRAAVQYAVSATYGPTPVPEAIERCEAILEAADHDRRTSGLVRSLLSRLVAMGGDIARGRALYRDAQRALGETGRTLVAASTSLDSCGVEMLAGDPEAAERELRRDHELLTAMDEHYMLSTVSGELARVLVAQGRTADAWTFSREAEALAASDDVASQVLWRLGRARLLSANGRRIAARELAEEAVELLVGTDARVTQAEALMDLAEILRGAGELSRAESTAREALALCNAKGNVVAAEAARRWIGALASVPAQRM